MVHRRARHRESNKKELPFHLFTDQESDGGEHGDATVRELGLAVALQRATVDAVAETESVEPFRERRGGALETSRGGLLSPARISSPW